MYLNRLGTCMWLTILTGSWIASAAAQEATEGPAQETPSAVISADKTPTNLVGAETERIERFIEHGPTNGEDLLFMQQILEKPEIGLGLPETPEIPKIEESSVPERYWKRTWGRLVNMVRPVWIYGGVTAPEVTTLDRLTMANSAEIVMLQKGRDPLVLRFCDGGVWSCPDAMQWSYERGRLELQARLNDQLSTRFSFTRDGTAHLEKIATREIVLDTDWADEVFEQDYDLPDLDEVESHIREHGHLPGIPTAREVQDNGLLLGDSHVRLLKKIEELTLYLIKQDKRVSELEANLDSLRSKTIRPTSGR